MKSILITFIISIVLALGLMAGFGFFMVAEASLILALIILGVSVYGGFIISKVVTEYMTNINT